jgi:hypothetical protein
MSKGKYCLVLWLGISNIFNISLQLDSFRSGSSITQEEDIKTEKGTYFVSENITLKSQCEKNGDLWQM